MCNSCKIILPVLILAIAQISCEDVIDIQTADAPTQIVVDGWLTNQSTTQTIRLTRSQPYFNTDLAQPISGASVMVTSNTGTSIEFEENSSGTYTWTPEGEATIGNIGEEFLLEVTLDDQVLSSSSVLFPAPKIDSITQEFRENELGGPDGIYAQFLARDLPGLGNTYWIKTYKNDFFLNKPEEINLAFDAGFDGGSQIDGIIFIPPIRELVNPALDSAEVADEVSPYATGDKIRVEIHSLSFEAFRFMQSVRDQILNASNTIFASPIANSPGNIISSRSETKVLGVFCVSAVEVKERIIE